MSISRLPKNPVLRCVLALSLAFCIFVPTGLICLVFELRNEDWARDWARTPILTGLPLAQSIPRVVSEPQPEPTDRASAPAPPMLDSQIAEVVAQSQQRSSEENLSQLKLMSDHLNSVASDKSVDDLTSTLQSWMKLDRRASQPKTEAELSELDIDSAQLHDVEQIESRPGVFQYRAILIDAQGQAVTIKLTEAEGKETYALMRRIKGNPLLEKVYRRIAMPLLDTLVESARDRMKTATNPPPAP